MASFNRVLCKAAGTHRDLHKTQLDQTLPKYQLWSQRGRNGKERREKLTKVEAETETKRQARDKKRQITNFSQVW